ncbi:hypothetical protein DBV15_12771 [Temnothorax longispinosus]|uniref:Uncharacterized protein n=1 Tax=Temnothorax longispinosus TaxID=300112 RepID=A0A4S2J9L2_9HYME|nr:hypothetical protein DBV15_12771 [Temnothorax longispinosus]
MAAIPREFYDPGEAYERSHEGHDHARTERFWRPPGNEPCEHDYDDHVDVSHCGTKISSCSLPASVGVSSHADRRNFRPKGDPRERWCINNRGCSFFGHVTRGGGEIAHKEPGPHQRKPARTEVLLNEY